MPLLFKVRTLVSWDASGKTGVVLRYPDAPRPYLFPDTCAYTYGRGPHGHSVLHRCHGVTAVPSGPGTTVKLYGTGRNDTCRHHRAVNSAAMPRCHCTSTDLPKSDTRPTLGQHVRGIPSPYVRVWEEVLTRVNDPSPYEPIDSFDDRIH